MKSLRHPATILAGLALLVSLAGTGLAAHRYLITSTSQISPKVLGALHGNSGPRGLQGVQGVPGHQGVAGSARASGYVTGAGSLSVNSTGIASVTRVRTEFYCIAVAGAVSGVDVAFTGPDYTNDSTSIGGTGTTSVVEVAVPNGGCPVGQFQVVTFRDVNGTTLSPYDEPFFFMVP